MIPGIPDLSRRQWLMAGAVVVGLAASTVHWLGLALGGALVGLSARTTRRGLLGGAGFGILAWGLFAIGQFRAGAWPPGDALTLFALALGVAVGLGVVGASVRALR